MGQFHAVNILVLFCGLLFCSDVVLSLPHFDKFISSFGFNNSHSLGGPEYSLSKRQSKPSLRILSLGASIVYGIGSSNGNGFRKPLRDALRYEGFEVNMVGTLRGGDFIDSDVEATPGAIISEIRTYLKRSLGYKANIVVINGGTNDVNLNIDVNNAGSRMRGVLDDIWGAEGMSNTCVFLSTLLPTTNPTGALNRLQINGQYRNLVSELSGSKCIYLADMDPEDGKAGHGWINLSTDMVSDGIHPNDQGHKKMASIFWKAIDKAYTAGKIKEPSPMEGGQASGCDKVFGDGIYAGGLTQVGSGLDDGIYYHDSVEMGILLTIENDKFDRDQWRFARLYGPKYDDLLEWYEKDANTHAFGVWKNLGGGKFKKISDMNPDLFCIPRGLHFIDMNADGYDDIVCIGPDGAAYLSINQRDGTNDRPPTFKRVSASAKIKEPEGYAQDRVRLADIDGDGRGDYCIIDDTGNVWCWRNGWVDDIPQYWQALGMRFPAKGMGDIRGVRFEDINGDGRDDWIWVSDVGATTTWTSARSCAAGVPGDGLNVAWRQGFFKGQSSGPTHFGMGSFASSGLRDRIHFARIFGEAQDFGLLGRQDYVFMEHIEASTGKHKFNMRVWKNVGFGGTKMLADGNKYCNMKGWPDGREDYVWTLSKGEMTIYPNKGVKFITTAGQHYWGDPEVIWEPTRWLGAGNYADRRDLHLVDWDGDGVCDIVWTNPNNNNRPQLWINRYAKTGKWDWDYYPNPSGSGAVQCDQRRGLGFHDLAVRFADLTGNGRGDYLCLEKDGRVTGFVHRSDDSWENVGQIKFAEGKDRANLRWADVNGDGADDMLWVEKFTGDGYVWYNRGRGDPSNLAGSAFSWQRVDKPVYDGNHAGTCMYYPDMDGNGRADMHSIIGTFNNQAETWYNPSCGLTDHVGDDPGGINDPQLPLQPGGDGSGNDGGGSTDPDHPPYNPLPKDDDPLPPCDGNYNTLDDIERDAGLIPLYCGPQYVIPILHRALNDAKKRYNEIIDSGYDKYFGIYAKYVVDYAPQTLESFMTDKGNDYFTCDIVEQIRCCRACDILLVDGDACKWCKMENCDLIDSPYGDPDLTWEKRREPCPPDYSQRGVGPRGEQTIYWNLKQDKKDDFYSTMLSDIGVPEDNLKFTDTLCPHCYMDNACSHQGPDDYSDYCYNKHWWMDVPVITNFKTSDVLNPKKIFGDSLDNINNLLGTLGSINFEIRSGQYINTGSAEDIVDAVAMPIFMIDESLDYMEQVVEMAKEIEAYDIKFFILNFLSAIFFIMPAIGEALGSAGYAFLGRLLSWIGELGSTALGIEGVISDPNTAPLLIFGLVMSVKSIRDTNNAVKAAELRRGMSRAAIAAFSKTVAEKLDKIGGSVNKAATPPICIYA